MASINRRTKAGQMAMLNIQESMILKQDIPMGMQ
jgi:hypothetical protein